MTEEQYLEKYNNKTIKELCNEWRKEIIKKYKSFENLDCTKEINLTKKTPDEEIIKYAIALYLEEIKNVKTN